MKCIYCGCTEDRACPGGCHWVDRRLAICSACADLTQRILALVLHSLVFKNAKASAVVPPELGHRVLDLICRESEDYPRSEINRWPDRRVLR